MLQERKSAFDLISTKLAEIVVDIQHHQKVNDLSLNIHSENFFRGVFNDVYGYNLINANLINDNAAYIDLVDNNKKIFIQVTSDRTKGKIIQTLKALEDSKYQDYTVRIYYLLEKSKPNNATVKEVKQTHGVDILECVFDRIDLLKDINDLANEKLIKLANDHFAGIPKKYSELAVLDVVCAKLIADYPKHQIDFDESFGSIDVDEKIILNGLNSNISFRINESLDTAARVESYMFGSEDALTKLKEIIVYDYYKKILVSFLKVNYSKDELNSKNTYELTKLAGKAKVDFNKVIERLHKRIDSEILVTDYNSMMITWVIVAYFFELCDVGVKNQ